MRKRTKETTLLIYANYPNGEEHFYVRLAPLETARFPHGLVLGSSFDSKEEAEKYRDDIWEYFKQAGLVYEGTSLVEDVVKEKQPSQSFKHLEGK